MPEDLEGVFTELEKMTRDLEHKKTKLAQNSGRLDSLNERLEKDFGFETLPAAKKKLKQMIEEFELEKKDLIEGFQDLKGRYSW